MTNKFVFTEYNSAVMYPRVQPSGSGAGCVDDGNASNAIISPLGGIYILEDNILTINSDGSQLAGPITFSGNTATWTSNDPEEITNEVVITLEKAN